MKRNVIVCLVVALLLISCGRKGSPKPPEEFAPSPVKYLSARGTVNSVVLTWESPVTDASGEDLEDLAGFVVKRNIYDEEEDPDFDEIAEIEVRLSEEAVEQPQSQYSFSDGAVEAGQVYDYMVLPVNEDGVDGVAGTVLRVTFIGESSRVEVF